LTFHTVYRARWHGIDRATRTLGVDINGDRHSYCTYHDNSGDTYVDS